MPKNSRQTKIPDPFTTKELARDNWKELIVKMSNAVTCFRYLTSKIVYTDKSITMQEAVVLFAAFEEMMRKIEIDRTFKEKYFWTTFVFRSVFQSLDALVEMDPSERRRMLEKQYECYRGIIVSRRYYFSVEGQSANLYQTFLRKRFPKKFPAKAFVGKGYGDHGTAKNEAYDGSPAWQEVAMQNQIENEDRAICSNYYRTYQVNECQLYGKVRKRAVFAQGTK